MPIRISTKPTHDQVAAIIEAGPGAVVHHPLASYGGRKRQLEQALGHAGVPQALVRSLGWSSTGAPAPARVEKLEAVLSAAANAHPDHPLFADAEPEDTMVDGDIAGSD